MVVAVERGSDGDVAYDSHEAGGFLLMSCCESTLIDGVYLRDRSCVVEASRS